MIRTGPLESVCVGKEDFYDMKIRKAEEKDIEALLDIYNYEVRHGTATLDLEPKTLDEWKRWFSIHNIGNHPLYVAETEGSDAAAAGKGAHGVREVTGYASLSAYREKEAYCSTVELSVYIATQYRRNGVASALMERILQEARQDERIHTVVSVITSGNAASTRLHEKFGFTFCGTIKEVGMKFGKYQDIDNYSLRV